MEKILEQLNKIANEFDENFTHFLVKTELVNSSISGRARMLLEPVAGGHVLGIIGGIIVDKPSPEIALPIGFSLYIHQIRGVGRGTINHSCEPNCKILGFNRLCALRDISNGEELTIDYGTVSIGSGSIIISNCRCGSTSCRGTITTKDFLVLPFESLGIYGKYMRNYLSEK